ncbi:MAG: polysaccharide biosynthesis tyrosine autokinase [Phycisphaerae bacterium]|nr:polysaccharide biosynthesis tyrosine autokinase [Phycisphaerae bacterium]
MTTVPATIQEQVALAPSQGEGGGGAGLTAGDITAILKHRLVMIIVLWWFFSAIGVGLFFMVYFKYPTYRASTLIQCISDAPIPAGEFTARMTEDRQERFLASEAMNAVSPPVLLDVLQSPEVRGTAWFREADQSKLRLELEEVVSSRPVKDTNYFRISMGCRVWNDPARIVNQIAKTYLDKVRNRTVDAFRQELAGYQAEQNTLESKIRQKLTQIQEFVSTLEPGELQSGTRHGPMVMEIIERQSLVARLELQTLELESFVNIYSNPAGPGVTVEDSQTVEADPRVISLDNQINFLEQEVEVMLHDLGPEHREVKAISQRLDEARRQAAKVRETRLREILDFKLEQVNSAFLNSQHQLLLEREKISEARAKQADLERKLAEHETLKDELEMLRDTKEQADEYIREVERVVRERNAVRIEVAQQAVDPLERSSPKLLLLPACVLVALALAMGIAIGLDLLDTSVRTPQDIVRHLSLPLLGTVPDVDDEEVDIEKVETAVQAAPHSMVAEAFRTIRTNLQFSAPPDRQRTLLIASPRPEDGKTTIACNLAASIALGGRRVLLVDANLRRPSLHRIFPNIEPVGLSNYLVGGADLDKLICKTDLANLDVVGSGPMPPNPAELLNGPLASEFLDTVSSRYDQIIIDMPPVLLASDVSVLAPRVDGVILVCRAKDNSRGQVLRALSLLERVNAFVFGGILNCAQVRRGGYFREQLRTFYEYQEEGAEADRKA